MAQLSANRVGGSRRGRRHFQRRVSLLLFILLTAGTARADNWRHIGDDIDSEVEKSWLFRASFQDEASGPAETPSPLSELLNLPLEELAQQRVRTPGPPPATLTDIEPIASDVREAPGEVAGLPRTTPAAVTRIDYEDIWSSGARNLNELFDIFVPNVEIIRHHFGVPRLGVRGIIKDRDDSYLLLVNGKVMNHRTEEGAYTERDLPMLGDIHHIDFVRGPGSAIYGPGAVSGVINIVTHNGLTFQGTDATVRQGFLEEFTAAEIRHGFKLSEDTGVFLYYGYSDYQGADQRDAPYVFGSTITPRGGGPAVPAGMPMPFDIPDDHRSYRSIGKHKLHMQITHGDLDVWFRYTVGGEQVLADRRPYSEPPVGTAGPGDMISDVGANAFGYQQFTAFATYNKDLTPDFNLLARLSYDTLDFERLPATGTTILNGLETEIYGRLLATWTPHDDHTVAFGADYSREEFGLPSPGFPNIQPRTQRQGFVTPWITDTVSFLGEYRWSLGDRWTTFLGARADKHTYTNWLYSPRIAVVHTPNDVDTIKFIANQSVRRSVDDELRAEFLQQGTLAAPEIIQSLELRHERQVNERFKVGSSFFFQDIDVVARNSTLNRNVLFANQQNWGVEVEAQYRNECTRLVASHSYTQLVEFTLFDPNTIQGFSAAPYGFGNELANWSPNLTKVYFARDVNPCWSYSGSLRVYWGFPGGADSAAFNQQIFQQTGTPNGSLAFTDPGNFDPFRANMYLNGGIENRPTDHITLRLDLYNVLGWFDIDLNKRNYILRPSEWRAEAPAVALTGRIEF